MKVRQVNKVLYPFGFIQDKVIKKGIPSMMPLLYFLTWLLLFHLYSIESFTKHTDNGTL